MLLAYIHRSITHRVHFLDKRPQPPWGLLICTKDLLVEATPASHATLARLPPQQLNLISYREGHFLRTCLRIVSRSLPQNICSPTKNVGTPNAPRRKASSAAAARTRSVSGSSSVAQNKSAARPISSANAIQMVSSIGQTSVP